MQLREVKQKTQKEMKIAIYQADTKDNQTQHNIERYKQALTHLEKDTDLLIFPEMYTTGFTIDTDYAEDMQGESLEYLKQIAKEKDIAVDASILIKEGDKYINRQFFVTKDKVEYYDKAHLFCLSKEPKIVSKGNREQIVEYKGWRIKLLTCYDLRFPQWARNRYSEEKGYDYDILIYVASWADDRISHWEMLLPARAIENQAYVLGSNRTGIDHKGYTYKGASIAINYKGNTIVRAKDNSEEIIYATLDKDALNKYREKFPVALDWD